MAFAKAGKDAGKEEEVVFEYTPEPAEPERAMPQIHFRGGGGGGRRTSDRQETQSCVSRRRNEYEAFGSAGLRGFEPPEQRLARLSAEVADLLRLAELPQHAAREGLTTSAGDVQGNDPAAVTAELKVLEQRLGGLARDSAEAFRSPAEVATAGRGLGSGAGSLAAQLERLASGGGAAVAAGTGDGHVTYEISYAPSEGGAAESSKIASLESSLAVIEKQLGVFEQCPFADLQSAVFQLQRRLAALDATKLEGIRGEVAKTLGEVEAVLAKKQELEAVGSDPDVDRKAAELYELCHKWAAVAPSLPAIISRLQSLQALHQESASFASRLAALEHQQEELTKLLESTNESVLELSRGLKENMAIMRDSVQGLEEKISKAVRK